MGLTRAQLTPETPPGARSIPVLFNPTEYGLDKANALAEVGVPGLESPILQYVHGNARTLTLDLFFDTYEEGLDVREHTDAVYGLLGVEATSHAPPVCVFEWGAFRFRCVLERVGGRFTLFLADGTPVRATLSVSLKEFVDVATLVRGNPTQSADHAKTHTVIRGETLASIAWEEYGDARRWRPIADANGLANPRRLEAGRVLRIPALT